MNGWIMYISDSYPAATHDKKIFDENIPILEEMLSKFDFGLADKGYKGNIKI